MARIFITGSTDGLGKMAAQLLVSEGHKVIIHARNDKRVQDALKAVLGAEAAISGDLSSIEETKAVAEQVNADAIHAKYENGILKLYLPKKEQVKETAKQVVVQ